MDQSLISTLSLITAALSALATMFAAWAAIKGPKAAAKIAEQLRAQSEMLNERRRLKLFVFTTLMRERANLTSVDAVNALNLIDIAFIDVRKVREAWADLYAGFEPTARRGEDVQAEKVKALLREMADDIGLSDNLRSDDFNRIYYPTAIAEAHRLQSQQIKRGLEALSGQPQSDTNAAEDIPEGWPPRPEPKHV